MDRRNVLLWALMGLGAASIAGALFWPTSKEEQVREQLSGLAQAIGFSEPIQNPIFFGSALADRLEEYVADTVMVDVPQVRGSAPRERGQMAVAAAMAMARYGALAVDLDDVTVQLMPGGATASADARVLASVGGEPRTESRRVHFELVEESGEFKVNKVRVSEPR